ncbi:hypothetical protein GA0070615_2086 [Micromonospora aurantiaca]|nr:hypothetical protein GA0070615_2086 [Micromonospora aurantiaca]
MARTGREANPVPISRNALQHGRRPEADVPGVLFPPSRIASTAVGWAENRGDEFAGWGHSVWYFEVGDDGWPVRQAETYDAGRVLRYGPNHSEEPSSLSVLRSLLGHVNRR